ncbi:GIY-YIG nuclease family protein [Daejeonella lutea]|uniref:Predicted endonuclease, GIY-YIG superfamily n=1 Tax=Daejeonella lutea TaxID=572036 RepID=A0A1T5AIV0_9SPHI|nr:Predicted endonuclease, GIY-YIG superfamily [Daejeonella lutea]
MWFYVYILRLNSGKHYVGCTSDLNGRIKRHLKGYVPATKQHLPVGLIWCCSFPEKHRAFEFELYLKSGSGRSFAKKHLLKKTPISNV